MNRYKELVSKKAYYEVLCEEQKETIKKLEDKLEESKKSASRIHDQLRDQLGRAIVANNVNADIIQFLVTKEFINNKHIEFAAIKTYRDGWVTMCLNGKEICPNGKDVTVWANSGEPVEVEVSGS